MGESTGTLRMANPVKYEWAARHGADYERMLDAGTYKEQHRPGMAKICVEVRAKSIGYFPREAILMDGGQKLKRIISIQSHANFHCFCCILAIGKPVWICPEY